MVDPLDPAAATAAYLATIPPDALRAAISYTHGSHWILVVGKLLTVVANLFILRLGLLPRIREWIGTKRPRPVLTAFGVGTLALLLQSFLLLPWTFYAEFWRERSFGLSNETGMAWLLQDIILVIVGAIVGGLLLIPFYAIVRRTGRRWWMWSAALCALLVISAISLTPYLSNAFNHYRTLPAGPVASAIGELADKSGIPNAHIYVYDGSKQTDRFTARVTGTAGNARIEISDTVLREPVDLAATRAVVAHEIGHFKHHHLILLGIAVSILCVLGLFIASRCFLPIAERLGRGSINGLEDPAGFPALLAISAIFTLITTPVVNTAMRLTEADADTYGLNLAREPDGAARALLATTSYRAPNPSELEEALFYDHPGIGHRIRRAMDWKAAHTGHR